jgi:hypothetical protein
VSLPVDSNLDLQNANKVVNSPDPTSAQDVATKHYVDSFATGIIYKQAVQAASDATIGNISVNAPGANLDGFALAAGERILLTAQNTPSQNGIWVWNGAAVALTRPTDFQTGSTEHPGTAAFVENGTDNIKITYNMNTSGDVVVDTTAQTWTKSSGASTLTFNAPLTQSGNTVSLNNGNPLPIANGGTGSATAPAARAALGAVGKFATTVGDGASTSFNVNHNLGTEDITLQVIDMGTGNAELCQWIPNGVNSVTVGPFGIAPAVASGSAPGSGAGKRVVVIG